MPQFVQNIIDWPFLNEPLYRWAVFMVAMGFITTGWHGVLEFMK